MAIEHHCANFIRTTKTTIIQIAKPFYLLLPISFDSHSGKYEHLHCWPAQSSNPNALPYMQVNHRAEQNPIILRKQFWFVDLMSHLDMQMGLASENDPQREAYDVEAHQVHISHGTLITSTNRCTWWSCPEEIDRCQWQSLASGWKRNTTDLKVSVGKCKAEQRAPAKRACWTRTLPPPRCRWRGKRLSCRWWGKERGRSSRGSTSSASPPWWRTWRT